MAKGERILVVDDVNEQRQIASVMLRRLGYEVASAASGEEAVAMAEEKPQKDEAAPKETGEETLDSSAGKISSPPIGADTMASIVNRPNTAVGVKLENMRMENPAQMARLVATMGRPIWPRVAHMAAAAQNSMMKSRSLTESSEFSDALLKASSAGT